MLKTLCPSGHSTCYSTLYPKFGVGKAGRQEYIGKLSSSEVAMLNKFILDDYYCGRGFV